MPTISRRTALQTAAGTVLVASSAVTAALADETQPPKLSTLEGELKVHPKYLYRYYVSFGDGQRCGLFGADHARDPESLKGIPLPARVRVRGTLGTEYHAGGTKTNLSPFPPTWMLFMDVHEVEELKSAD